jgi:hypothetical protein
MEKRRGIWPRIVALVDRNTDSHHHFDRYLDAPLNGARLSAFGNRR